MRPSPPRGEPREPWLARLDPNDDPRAEPLSKPALVVLSGATLANVFVFFFWKYQPMQDWPIHLANTTYVADWGRAGSVLAKLFDAPDLLSPNTLLYTLAGVLGRAVGIVFAAKVVIAAFALVGIPLSILYALRVFGRSAWGAVLGASLVFGRLFVSGFVTMLMGIPLSIVSLTLLYQLLQATDRKRALRLTLILTVLFAVLFVTHVFVFMWTGFLAAMLCVTSAPGIVLRRGLRDCGRVAMQCFVAVVPALLLYLRFVSRTSGLWSAHKSESSGLGARFDPPDALFRGLGEYLAFTNLPMERQLLLALLVLTAVSLVLGQYEARRRGPWFELACIVSLSAFFVLPIGIRSEGVVSERVLHYGTFLLPFLVVPVAAKTSRLARFAVIAGILGYAGCRFAYWTTQLVAFERAEAVGLDEVLAAAPPHKRIHYVHSDTRSKYFYGQSLWHVEGLYVASGLGTIQDVAHATEPGWWFHYRSDVHPPAAVAGENSADWATHGDIWSTYDLVITRNWHPSALQRAAAEAHGTRLAASGAWELWASTK